MWVNGRHRGIGCDESPSAGEPCGVNADHPEDDTHEGTIESPVVRLRRPWRFGTVSIASAHVLPPRIWGAQSDSQILLSKGG